VRPYVELLPAFADVVFERGAEGFSMLVAANGLGALAGGLWLAQRGSRRRPSRTAKRCSSARWS
jgi:hypothetical protein